MQTIKLNEATAARRTIFFLAANDPAGTAYTAALAGADLMISKAGGTEANSAGTATHIANGLYKYEFAAAEVDTLGAVSLRIAKAGLFGDVFMSQVVAFNPYDVAGLGLTNLDAAVGTRLAEASYDAPEALLTYADGVETGLTVQQALRVMSAVLVGRLSGAQTGVEVFRNTADTKNRVTATIDSSGNRTNITTDLT